MKKMLCASLMLLFLGINSVVAGSPDVENLKLQKEVLKLNTQLTNLRLEYDKALTVHQELCKKASDINAGANSEAVSSYTIMDASASAKAAKERAKVLDKVENANKKVVKSQKKLDKLQKNIEKVQRRLDDLNKRVVFITQ